MGHIIYQGNPVDIEQEYQNSSDYQDNMKEWASENGYKWCGDCTNWFNGESDYNSHICAGEAE